MSAYGFRVPPVGVTPADIAAAIAAYAATDVGVNPLYTRTQAFPADDSLGFTSGLIFPAGTHHAVGAVTVERNGIVATATWSAWMQDATGEILVQEVQEAATGVTFSAAGGLDPVTHEWYLRVATTALPAVASTVTVDVWAVR